MGKSGKSKAGVMFRGTLPGMVVRNPFTPVPHELCAGTLATATVTSK